MGSSFQIRRATVSEKGALEALQRRASLNNAGDRMAILANPEAIDLPIEQLESGHVSVLEQDEGILGFCVALPREDGGTELDGLFVEPDLWRKGLGRMLVEHCAEASRARESSALRVTGNPHAEGFYRACGFGTIGNVSTRFGEGLLMKRLL